MIGRLIETNSKARPLLVAWPDLQLGRDGLLGLVLWHMGAAVRYIMPQLLWSDEAQETVTSYDGEFQSLCRGSKCCTVYLTQSLPTYYSKNGRR